MNNKLTEINKIELIKTLIGHTPIAYIILDEDFKIHYINKSFLELRELDLEKTLGEKCYNISNNGVVCPHCAIKNTLTTGRKDFISRKDILPDGSVRYIDDYSIPLETSIHGKKFVLEIMVNRTRELKAQAELRSKYADILKYLLNLIEIKDDYTATHSQNVQEISMQIGKFMNLGDEDLFILSLSSILHDIGKVKIPFEILTKPGRLTDEEYNIIKKHAVYSSEIISDLKSFSNIKDYVRAHHERPDGKGYPDGLKGDEIPLFSRIIAVADCYDAMVSKRCYKDALSEEYALSEIKKGINTQFDETVATAFLNMKEKEKSSGLEFNTETSVQRTIESHIVESEDKTVENLDLLLNDDLFAQIWDETPCAYALVNHENEFVISNGNFHKLLELKGNITGKKYYDVLDMDNLTLDRHIINLAIKDDKMVNTMLTYKVGGRVKYIEAFAVPYNEKGYDAAILVMLDRTKEEELAIQLQSDFTDLTTKLAEIIDYSFKDIIGQQQLENNKEKIEDMTKRLEELKDSINL